MSLPGRRDGSRKGFRFGRKAEASAGRKERMAVHEEAARLQQGSVFQPDGGLDKGAAYAQAAKNYDAGKMGGTTEFDHDTPWGKVKSQSARHWGSSDRTITDKKGY